MIFFTWVSSGIRRQPEETHVKKIRPRAAAVLAAALAVSATAAHAAHAADWPERPVRIIVPAPAGGPYDRTIRPLAQEMAATLGQSVIVDNRPGTGNIVGTQAGANADPDGYTVTMTGMLNTIAASLYRDLSFDIVNDFEHIGAIGQGAQWLVVRADAPMASFADLLERARREPGGIDYASSGPGSSGHLVMELLQRATATRLTHVPYKGGAPALQDVLGGVVPMVVIPLNAALPHVRSGALRVLAVSSAQRHPAVPDVPTFRELGYPQLEISAWVGLSAPKGTPAKIVDTLNAALRAGLNDPKLLARLEAEGMIALPTTPAEYAAMVRSNTESWGELVRALGLQAN